MSDEQDCPECMGSGLVPAENGEVDVCPRCGGYGFFTDEHPDLEADE